jgi:quercetin dioxygenase-like cupin family protein
LIHARAIPIRLLLHHYMVTGVIPHIPAEAVLGLATVTLVLVISQEADTAKNDQSAVRSEVLLRSSSSWDGQPCKAYPSGQPELSILKITVPAHTNLEWHSHPIPNAAYILTGELTIERKKDGRKQPFTAGQTLPEMVDTLHRGVTGDQPVVLIVFYAGSLGVPLTQYPSQLNPP